MIQERIPAIDPTRPIYGNPGGRVQIISYGNFSCGPCRRGWQVIKKLVSAFDGDVAVQHRYMTIALDNISSSIMREMLTFARPELVWEFHDTIMHPYDATELMELDLLYNTRISPSRELVEAVRDRWLNGRLFLGKELVPMLRDLLGQPGLSDATRQEIDMRFRHGIDDVLGACRTAVQLQRRYTTSEPTRRSVEQELSSRFLNKHGINSDWLEEHCNERALIELSDHTDLSEAIGVTSLPFYYINGVGLPYINTVGYMRLVIEDVLGIGRRSLRRRRKKPGADA
jgi:hypothetical protein